MTTDEKLQAFEGLLNEVSGALADLVAAAQDKRENTSLDEISNSLTDICVAIEARAKGQPLAELTAALKGLRIEAPAVNVIVQPTKIQIMTPDNKGATWEVCIPDKYGGSDRVMTIKKLS